MGRKLPKVLTAEEQEAFIEAIQHPLDVAPSQQGHVSMDRAEGRGSSGPAARSHQPDLPEASGPKREGELGSTDPHLFAASGGLFGLARSTGRRFPRERLLFPTRDGDQVKTSYHRRMVKKTALEADIKEAEKVSPYTHRYTFATDVYRQSQDLRAVQRMLGHEDISTTQIYRHLGDENMEAILEDFRTVTEDRIA